VSLSMYICVYQYVHMCAHEEYMLLAQPRNMELLQLRLSQATGFSGS